MRIVVFANAFTSLSGGDKILVEYSRRWMQSGVEVKIVTNEKGKTFCLRHGIREGDIEVWESSFTECMGIYISSTYKTVISGIKSIFFNSRDYDILFSASDFWPDVFAALLAKAKASKAKWLAACYRLSPSPWGKIYSGKLLRGIVVCFAQRLSLWLIRRFADAVFTASEPDRHKFYNERQLCPRTVIAIRGGVDVKAANSVPEQEITYDAIFVGRLHPQKCVDELIDIWRMLLQNAPQRKLALVGAGPLENKLRKKVANESIEHAITFLGIVDGMAKIRLLKSSRVFVSASRFDSGNIALDEALACGVPGVIYDLPQLYYPKGVIKVPCGEVEAFVKAVLRLLGNGEVYRRLSKEAVPFANDLAWDVKAPRALEFIKSL